MIALIGMALAQDLPDFSADPIDADRLHPSMDGQFLAVQDARPLEGRGFQLRVLGSYASQPYVWVDRDTGEVTPVVTSAATTVLGGAFFAGRARIGLDVPVLLRSTGPVSGGFGLGDAHLQGRWSLLEGGDESFGAALTGGVGFPLGSADTLLAPSASWSELGFASDYQVGRVLTAVRVGFHFGPRATVGDLAWDDQLVFGVGTRLEATDTVDLAVEVVGASQLDNFLGLGQGTPIELLGSANVEVVDGVYLRAGGGAGLTKGIGAPEWRGLAGVTWRPDQARIDTDLDGLADGVDACPEAAEDPDGFRDEDGCPDVDDDGDLLPDTEDACPREQEDIDGYEDDDGCPEGNARVVIEVVDWGGRSLRADTVKLGDEMHEVTSSVDVMLPTGSFELEIDAPGHSPWFDTVEVPESGVVEIQAQLQAFGPRGYVEVHAKDHDGVPQRELSVLIDSQLRAVQVFDGKPQLQLEPGSHELTVGGQGLFPQSTLVEVVEDEQLTLELTLHPEYVRLGDEQLHLEGSIEFKSSTDEVLAASKPILDQIAATLTAHPEIKLLRVEGHTDSTGPEAMNLRLSQERADSVARELRERGIAPGRVYAVGFGEDFPVADNDTEEGKAQNRRVDFFIEERN